MKVSFSTPDLEIVQPYSASTATEAHRLELGGTWRTLFSSLAVPIIYFQLPLMLLLELPSAAYYMTWREIFFYAAFLAANLLLMALLVAATTAAVLFIFHAQSFAISLAGVATIGIVNYTFLIAIRPFLKALLGHQITFAPYLILAVTIIGINCFLLYEYSARRVFEKLARLNHSRLWLLYAVCGAAVLMGVLTFPGWRSFDSAPHVEASLAAADSPPNVLLISMDAFAADETSLFDPRLMTTPNLKRFAQRSYHFSHFSSTCSFTTTAVASLLTGKYPLSHRVFQLEGHLSPDEQEQNLGAILRDRGYTTAAMVTNPVANPIHLEVDKAVSYMPTPPISRLFLLPTEAMQLRGSAFFEQYLAFVGHFLKLIGPLFSYYNNNPWVRSSLVFDQSKEFISQANRPFFVWIHTFSPHWAYVPGPRFKGTVLAGNEYSTQTDYAWVPMNEGIYPPSYRSTVDKFQARYHESMAQVDSDLGEFLDWFAQTKAASNTVIIITSDHGESFYHSLGHASGALRYAELHIPLLIKLPGQTVGAEISDDADLTSIAPTILDVTGTPIPEWMEGHSLLPRIKDGGSRDEAAFAMYLANSSVFQKPRKGTVAVTSGKYKLSWYFPENRQELFDIATDPDQKTDLAETEPAVAAHLHSLIVQRFASLSQN